MNTSTCHKVENCALNTPNGEPEAVPERYKVAYHSYTLSYEVETALIGKTS